VAISADRVRVAGAPAAKPARLVGADEPIVLTGDAPRFVSRGGEKLEAALDAFDIDLRHRRAVDVGASTGGFTDCLLQRGATAVIALDVGYGQLHERIRADERVEVVERCNVRTMDPAFAERATSSVVTVDVSFISLVTIADALLGLLEPGGDLVALVKPQFEAGRAEVSKGRGIVKDPHVWHQVLDDVIAAFVSRGADIMGCMTSPLRGTEGNVEFLVHLRHGTGVVHADVDAVVAASS